MNFIGNILKRRGRAVTWLLASDWLIMVGAFVTALYFRRYAPEMNIIMIRQRLAIFPWLIRLGQARGLQRRVVLIGQSAVTDRFLKRRRDRRAYTMIEPVGVLSDRPDGSSGGVPHLGRISVLQTVVAAHGIEGAVICDPSLDYEELMALIEQCVRLFGWVDVHTEKSAVWHSRPDADKYFDIPFARITSITRNPLYFAYKRALDLVASGLALTLLSPLLARSISSARCGSARTPIRRGKPRSWNT